jgi:DUF1365 family protein
VLRAALAGERQPLTDRSLARAAATIPLVAVKTIAAIHWEALRLILKGARYRGPNPNAGAPVARSGALPPS